MISHYIDSNDEIGNKNVRNDSNQRVVLNNYTNDNNHDNRSNEDTE